MAFPPRFGHLEILRLCSSFPLPTEWKTATLAASAVLVAAGLGPGRAKARVRSDGESVAGRTRRSGRDAGRPGDPAVGAGPAEAQESRRPASRREVCEARCRPGASGLLLVGGARGIPARPSWGRRGTRKQGFVSFCQLGRGWRGGCQSLGDLWGGRRPFGRRRVGRRPPSRLENKEPGAGPAGAAPLRLGEAGPRRLGGEAIGSTSPTRTWLEESAALLFGKGRTGRRFRCHVVP